MKSSFLWGVAHSSFQVEGSPVDSDWRRWTQSAGRIADGSDAELGTDFWNRFERDLDWVTELGANAFRFSLAWERLETAPGVFSDEAFERYAKLLRACEQRSITPLVTLLHFALPGWLADKGGLASDDFAKAFERYAIEVQKRLGAYLNFVITINEPMVQVSFGYLNGIWPPGFKSDGARAAVAAVNLATAHALAYTALKKQNPRLQISIAKHWRLFEPHRKWNPIDRLLARLADKFFNQAFLQALLYRKATFAALGAKSQNFSFAGKGPLIDFLGVNYYGRMFAGFSFRTPFVSVGENEHALERSDLGWELHPKGLQNVLARWKAMAPDIPLLITENGVADSGDRVRSKFLTDHVLSLISSAAGLDVPLLGYVHWSLTDNFEWSEGLAPRFGLIEVTYPKSKSSVELSFKKRPAFFTYQRMIRGASRPSGADT